MAAGLAVPARAATLDRIVASVGYHAITGNDVVTEYHFESFLDGKSPTGVPSREESDAVLKRLISQTLLAEQIQDPGQTQKNGAADAKATLKEVRSKFSSGEAYRKALQELGMTEQQVLKRLEVYQRTLQMINNRLRPSAVPDPAEVQNYYKDTFVPEYTKHNSGAAPPLEKVRVQIREILVQKKMNELLNDWLDRLKSTHRVTIHEDEIKAQG